MTLHESRKSETEHREGTHNASVCGQVATVKEVKLEKGKGSV